MIAVSELRNSGIEESSDLAELAAEAERFLLAHRKWCRGVKAGYFDRGLSKVAVFFFEIDPVPPADPTVWVIVGDLPAAYMDTSSCPNGATALDGYVGAMREWVNAVLTGTSTKDLIPVLVTGSWVPVEPNKHMAEQLRGRLDFIDAEILPQWKDELDA